jgi:hypothetical protein
MPEALTNYAEKGFKIADRVMLVGWDVHAEMDNVRKAIFDYANPDLIAAAAACLQAMDAECTEPRPDLATDLFGCVSTPALCWRRISGWPATLPVTPPSACARSLARYIFLFCPVVRA